MSMPDPEFSRMAARALRSVVFAMLDGDEQDKLRKVFMKARRMGDLTDDQRAKLLVLLGDGR